MSRPRPPRGIPTSRDVPTSRDAPSELDALPLRRKPAQDRSRAKVERALDAADRLLDAAGPSALSLNRVAAEAGLSVGALHQYLPDRDAIVEVLAARYHRRLEALLEDALRGPSTGDPIRAVLRGVVNVYRSETALRSVRLEGSEAASRAHKRRMAEALRTLLVARGWAHGAKAKAVADVAFFAADAVLHEAFRRAPDGDRALLRELERMLRAYLPPASSITPSAREPARTRSRAATRRS